MRGTWSARLMCGTLLGVASLVGVLQASPGDDASRRGDDASRRDNDASRRGRELRDEVYDLVDAYIVMQVQERLELTDEQLARLMPLVRRQQKERRELERQRYQALSEMRRLFETGTAREERVAELLREVKSVEAELPVTLKRNQEAIDGLLSNVQQAKYRLLQAEVEHRLRELRRRVRGHGSGAGEGGDTAPHGRGGSSRDPSASGTPRP